MELTAHVVGQALPVRERVNVHGNLVRLCQVGLCKKKGRTTVDEKLVCKDHARLLREKDQFVDQSQAAFLVRRDYIRGKCASHLAMPVCNYVGCNRDKVTAKYRGFFCAGHLPVNDDLRGKIMAAKSDGDFEVQIPLRYNEIFLRKFLDEGHVHFYNSLVAKHGYVAPVLGIVGDQLVGVAGGQKTAELGKTHTNSKSPPSAHLSMYAPPAWTPIPFCSLFNCPYAGEFLFNGRNVCGAHLQQLSQPPAPPAPPLPPPESRPQLQAEESDTCAFRGCKKSGLCAHGRDYFCREHLTRLLVLDAHVAGQKLPPRTRVNNGGRVVQLCQIGHCTRNGNRCRDGLKVCKDHSLLLLHKERFVDKRNAQDYALHSAVSQTRVCSYVGCSSTSVTQKYHGVFCAQHLPVIGDIRNRIMMAKCHGDEAIQIPLRYNEIFLRKFLDEGHVEYYIELVARHGFVAPTVHVGSRGLHGISHGPHMR